MSPNAPEFVPAGEELMYNHMLQADRYAQEQMQMPMQSLCPGGRPPATPHSDRRLIEAELQKPTHVTSQFAMPPLDHRAFAAVRSMESQGSMTPPPPQHVPSEPQWPIFASESSEPVAQVVPPPPVLPGDAASAFAQQTLISTPTISPQLGVARPPPGLEDEATGNWVETAMPVCAEVPLCVEIQPEMQDMSTQTEGPACRACGAAFGCADKCPWSRDQLLGLREAFIKTAVEPEDHGALKAVRFGETSAARKKAGGA